MVELLLVRGADIHAKNDYALRWIADYGHTDTVELLLDRGANIHAQKDEALRYAARNGHTDTVKLLLLHGADIHAMDDWALWWAAGKDHIDTVKLLLNRGANIDSIHFGMLGLKKDMYNFLMAYKDEQPGVIQNIFSNITKFVSPNYLGKKYTKID